MLSERSKDALTGIKMNIDAISAFLADVTFEHFKSDLLTFMR